MDDGTLRAQLLALLSGEAHMGFDEAIADFPMDAINRRAPNVGYTPWHIVEHLRITQWDILEYVRKPEHISPDWPEGYWPAADAEATLEDWERSVEGFRADYRAIESMVRDESVDLTAPLPWTPGHTILREVLIVADHNGYHIGEFAILRQVMGTWGSGHE